jgi:hypothetical protein
MKIRVVLEQLDEFENLLGEFEKGTKGILGVPTDDSISAMLAKKERAHHSLDAFSLALVRKYEKLRPFIKMYSKCFTSISATDEEPEETYLALIRRGARSFQEIYDDLKFIRRQLEQLEPETDL